MKDLEDGKLDKGEFFSISEEFKDVLKKIEHFGGQIKKISNQVTLNEEESSTGFIKQDRRFVDDEHTIDLHQKKIDWYESLF